MSIAAGEAVQTMAGDGGGDAILNAESEPAPDDSFLVLLSVRQDSSDFLIPKEVGKRWELIMDTSHDEQFHELRKALRGGSKLKMEGLCVVVLRRIDPPKGAS